MNARTQCHNLEKGFTLVEIMVVVVIIGILASLLIPATNKSSEKTYSTVLVNDIEEYVNAFEFYNTENGEWPPNAGLNQIPTGLEDYLPGKYTASSGPGSGYRWQGNKGTLVLQKPNANLAVMIAMDEKIDDGDLSTGRLQKKGAQNYELDLD